MIGSKVLIVISLQVGVSFVIIRNFFVFGVYLIGVVLNYYDYDGYGNMFELIEVKNYEVGVKFDFVDGCILGIISVYKIECENQLKFIWWVLSVYELLKKGWDFLSLIFIVVWYVMFSMFWQVINII